MCASCGGLSVVESHNASGRRRSSSVHGVSMERQGCQGVSMALQQHQLHQLLVCTCGCSLMPACLAARLTLPHSPSLSLTLTCGHHLWVHHWPAATRHTPPTAQCCAALQPHRAGTLLLLPPRPRCCCCCCQRQRHQLLLRLLMLLPLRCCCGCYHAAALLLRTFSNSRSREDTLLDTHHKLHVCAGYRPG